MPDDAMTRVFEILDEIRASQADHRVALAEVRAKLDARDDHETRIRDLEKKADSMETVVKVGTPFMLALIVAAVKTFWDWITRGRG